MDMKIEHIDKSYIQGVETKELHALRLRCLQVNDKWFDDPSWPDCTQSEFIEKYGMLVDEMKSRGLSIPTKSIDRHLFAKVASEISNAETVDISKPYPNYHACRLRDPDGFKDGSMRTTSRKHDGKKYSIISGKLKGKTTMTEQAYRYHKDDWSKSSARTHCKDHDGTFEAAKEEKQASTFVKFVGVKKDDDSEERIVVGIVYEPDEEDTQGDWATPEEIRKAAYSFMESEQLFKINHADEAPSIHVLETFLVPVDYEIEGEKVKKGSWMMVSRVLDDDIWEGIKEGTYTGYSMAGEALRIESE